MSTFRMISAAKSQKVCPDAATQLKKTAANIRYLSSRRKQLLRKYPDQWVAIAKARVVGHAPDLAQLTAALSERGIAAADVMTHFISKSQQIFIL